jgi:hypothetical protein
MIKVSRITTIALVMLLILRDANAQKVKYSDVEREDSRNLNFEIIGRLSGNTIIYKNFRSDNYFSVYDNDMKLKEKIKLSSLPNKIINADFIAYPSFFYMIYQHQKKSIIYCEAIKFDANGKKMEETKILDTTSIPFYQNDNKIYQVLVSDNKRKIAIIKANKKNEQSHRLGAILLNDSLQQKSKRFFNVTMDGRNNFLDEFLMDNDGDIYMAKCFSNNGNEYVNKIDMIHIPALADTFAVYNVNAKEKILDEIILRMDNVNKRVIIQSFYFTKKRGNIEGLYVNFFSKAMPNESLPQFNTFNDTLRVEAKGINSVKTAFNDFFIREVYPRKDGGFIVTAESYYSTTRGGGGVPWNRFDYFGGSPYLTNYDYYNMGGRSWYWNSWDRYSSNTNTTYNAENVSIFSFSKYGSMEWSNVVHKNQRDDNTEDYISYQILLTGGSLHFLFNEKERSDYLMYDNSVSTTGQVTRHPTIKNLDTKRTIMPRHGKQISAREMIFPCFYKNYICFAKIEY